MANRQEIVCTYIYDNYVQFGRLRHDVISNKIQIQDLDPNETFESAMNARHIWRDITTSDINDIVCDCSNESGLQITAREVLAVLQSHRVPDVHPLREYVLSSKPWGSGSTRLDRMAVRASDGRRRGRGAEAMAGVLHQMVRGNGSQLAEE